MMTDIQPSQLNRFPDGLVEHISKTIGNYLTGTEIAQLMLASGYPEKSGVVGTKWRFLYGVLTEFNLKPGGQWYIAKVIQTFCDPTMWIGQGDTHRRVTGILNEGLALVNLRLNEKGQLLAFETTITHIPMTVSPQEIFRTKHMTVKPIFGARDISEEKDLCFVLMPFKSSFDRLYKEQIKPVVGNCGFRCLRSDDLFSATPILEDIWIHICKSRVIIADVTGRNPNVFYEMGIAHTVGKPIIIITQDKTDVPFDVAQIRFFEYSDDKQGWNTLTSNIISALRSTVTLT